MNIVEAGLEAVDIQLAIRVRKTNRYARLHEKHRNRAAHIKLRDVILNVR